MVLRDGGDHDVVGTQSKAVGQMVEGFGRISTDDSDVVAAFAPGKPECCLTRILISVGRKLRLVTRAAMDG